MKNIQGLALGLMLAIATVFSTVGAAQNTKPADTPKKTESCCAMTSCCCKGDSCSMSNHKHDSKQHQSKDGCCCCSGDSCNINMKNKQKQG